VISATFDDSKDIDTLTQKVSFQVVLTFAIGDFDVSIRQNLIERRGIHEL